MKWTHLVTLSCFSSTEKVNGKWKLLCDGKHTFKGHCGKWGCGGCNVYGQHSKLEAMI